MNVDNVIYNYIHIKKRFLEFEDLSCKGQRNKQRKWVWEDSVTTYGRG